MLVAAPFIGVLALIFNGEKWRKKLGPPQFHKDI
jgi:hypothetical protein